MTQTNIKSAQSWIVLRFTYMSITTIFHICLYSLGQVCTGGIFSESVRPVLSAAVSYMFWKGQERREVGMQSNKGVEEVWEQVTPVLEWCRFWCQGKSASWVGPDGQALWVGKYRFGLLIIGELIRARETNVHAKGDLEVPADRIF